MNWLFSFAWCSFSHFSLKRIGYSNSISNISTCFGFQILFLGNTGRLIFNEIFKGLVNHEDSSFNLSCLYGYFVYDLIHLLMEDNIPRNKTFIIHHTVSCLMIDLILDLQLKETFYQNLFLFSAEGASPMINARILLAKYPRLKALNKEVLKKAYLLFRVILFPMFALGFLTNRNIPEYTRYVLGSSFVGIYLATINWYRIINV